VANVIAGSIMKLHKYSKVYWRGIKFGFSWGWIVGGLLGIAISQWVAFLGWGIM